MRIPKALADDLSSEFVVGVSPNLFLGSYPLGLTLCSLSTDSGCGFLPPSHRTLQRLGCPNLWPPCWLGFLLSEVLATTFQIVLRLASAALALSVLTF